MGDIDFLQERSRKQYLIVKHIIHSVSYEFDINRKIILKDNRWIASLPRMSCYALMREFTNLTQKEIARVFEKTQGLIAAELKRFNEIISSDEAFSAKHSAAKETINDFIKELDVHA